MTAKVVHVEWWDSRSQNLWIYDADVDLELGLTHSVGFLVNENDKVVVISHSKDHETESHHGNFTIPKCAIKKMRTLCRVKI